MKVTIEFDMNKKVDAQTFLEIVRAWKTMLNLDISFSKTVSANC